MHATQAKERDPVTLIVPVMNILGVTREFLQNVRSKTPRETLKR